MELSSLLKYRSNLITFGDVELNITSNTGTLLRHIKLQHLDIKVSTVQFNSIPELQNPLQLELGSSTSIHVFLSISGGYHEDSVKFTLYIDFSTMHPAEGRKSVYYAFDPRGDKFRLEYDYRLVSCSVDFMGPGCSFFCAPVVANYTCNPSTGEKVCVTGKKGQDCDQCVAEHFYGPNCNLRSLPLDSCTVSSVAGRVLVNCVLFLAGSFVGLVLAYALSKWRNRNSDAEEEEEEEHVYEEATCFRKFPPPITMKIVENKDSRKTTDI